MPSPKRNTKTTQKASASRPAPGRPKSSKHTVQTVSKHCKHKAQVDNVVSFVSDERFLEMYEKHIYDLAANFRVTYKLPMEDQEDLQQDLRIKLISLDQKYRGPERRQYVKTALNNFCRDRWRRIMLYQKRNDPMMDKHINMQYAPDYTSEIEESHLISTLFQSISPVQKKIVQMHLGIGYPTRTENMRKIGKEVGLHEDEVRKELAMAMYKMKQLVQSGVVE